VAGLIAKFIFDRNKGDEYEISLIEYGIILFIVTFITAPGSVYLGWHITKQNILTFNEYRNGWEQVVYKEEIECYRDGPCFWEYDCDPYIYTYSCNCDDKGNCDTCTEIRYHDCPYVDTETNYYVKTTLGDYTIDSNRFPENPQAHRWRKSKGIPESVINNAGTGEHSFWTGAKNRLKVRKPGPVTKRYEYENYIYASEHSILNQYSAEIERFEKMGLLPFFQHSIYNFYHADKVYFVGFNSAEKKEWLEAVSYFNAAFGHELQGGLHLVVVGGGKASLISSNPDAYQMALKAYWQNKKSFSRDTLSKNAVVVIISSVDGKIIDWARVFTGMPIGNELMTVATAEKLRKAAFEPVVVSGILKDIFWGISDKGTKFRRVSMKAEDAGDTGTGFLYLASDIQPTPAQRWAITIITFVLSCIGWTVAIVADINFLPKHK